MTVWIHPGYYGDWTLVSWIAGDSLPPELPGKPSVGEVDQAQEVVYSRHRRVGYETKRHPGTIITIKSGLSKRSPIHQRRQWHRTPVLLPGKSHGWRSLVGCHLWGRDWSDLAAVVLSTFYLEHLKFMIKLYKEATFNRVKFWSMSHLMVLVLCQPFSFMLIHLYESKQKSWT